LDGSEENRAANEGQRIIIEPVMPIARAVFMARNLPIAPAKSKRNRPSG
jgi:hypothetical protein